MNLGKKIRLGRMMNNDTGRAIIVPMDHGVTLGAVKGLNNMNKAISDVIQGGANAVLMHKGFLQQPKSSCGKSAGLIMHLSASTALTPQCGRKVLVGSVQEALRNGCDGVSIHVNLGDPEEYRMLSDMGRVGEECELHGVPLLAMVYARGPEVKNSTDVDVLAHCARVGQELGADMVKISYPGSQEAFSEVTRACSIPLLIAGGSRLGSTRELLKIVYDSIHAGGSGVSVGRNVFQHTDRINLIRALHSIIHENQTVENALEIMETKE